MTQTKKQYATMKANGAELVYASSKKEAAKKLNVNIKDVYLY